MATRDGDLPYKVFLNPRGSHRGLKAVAVQLSAVAPCIVLEALVLCSNFHGRLWVGMAERGDFRVFVGF